jgi:RNA polymerase sigma-70 factor (ECF subfamily)
MAEADSTRWTVIREAAEGNAGAREEFVRRYEPIHRAYLGARWRHSPLAREIDDAVQDVFLACFGEGNALGRADEQQPGGFRAFLYGVTRNVARRAEEKRTRKSRPPGGDAELGAVEAREEPLSRVFDRAYARALVRAALDRLSEQARGAGGAAPRRVDLLRLRFAEDLPIREIARLWEEDPARLHHEYAAARAEYRRALTEIVREHHGGSPREVARECARLVQYLRR